MIPTIADLCLKVISENLMKLYPSIRDELPVPLKETLLERLSSRDMITNDNIPYIDQCLFVPELKNVSLCLHRTVAEEFLEKLVAAKCKFRQLHISTYNMSISIKCNIDEDDNEVFNGDKSYQQFSDDLHRYPESTFNDDRLNQVLAEIFINQDELEDITIDLPDISKIDFLSHIVSPKLKKVFLRIEKNVLNFREMLHTFINNNTQICDLYLRYPRRSYIDTNALDEYICCIASSLGGSCETLAVIGYSHLNDEVINAIAENCLNLKSLELVQLDGYLKFEPPEINHEVKSSSVVTLLNKCKHIEYLSLTCQKFSFNDVLNIPPNVKILKILPRIYDTENECSSIIFTHQDGQYLEKLDIPMSFLNSDSWKIVFSQIGPRLKELRFKFQQDGEAIAKAIVDYCPCLVGLDLCNTSYSTFEILRFIFQNKERAHKFSYLKLGDFECDDVEAAKYLLYSIVKSCEMLTQLTINSQYVDDAFLLSIANNCKCLTNLAIEESNETLPNDNIITDVGVCEIARKCNLEELYLRGSPYCKVTDRLILQLAESCRYLKILDYAVCDNIDVERYFHANKVLKNSVVGRIKITLVSKKIDDDENKYLALIDPYDDYDDYYDYNDYNDYNGYGSDGVFQDWYISDRYTSDGYWS
ncbi:uncharacterized protein LOC144450739 [Glandiceps talaboti]